MDEPASAPVSSVKAFFEMDQRKNEFLATLAHELRNPLAPIKSGLQLLAMMNLSPEADAVRMMMTRQVDQIVHLVDDLLDISRISCGKVLLDKQIVVMGSVVATAIEEASSLIAENGMTLEVIDHSDAVCVCGDPARLTQVLCNLLNNSAKFGRHGGKIVLTVQVHKSNLCIQVRDDGIGIDADRLKDIFCMYSQIDTAHSRGSAGLGIGLALVRTLVELHGGCVDAQSDGPDCGSTFTVTLPIAPGILKEFVTRKTAGRSSRSFRVLVVDDMRALRTVLKKLLQVLGHEVQSAENGAVALEMLDSFRPEVVFSDITMPVMGGYELAKHIRQRADLDSVHLVALTGYGQSSDRESAFEAGFDRHCTKPVDFQRLQELLDEFDADRQQTDKSTVATRIGSENH